APTPATSMPGRHPENIMLVHAWRPAVIVTLVAGGAATAQPPSFTPLPPPAGFTTSRAEAVSSDGSVVAGTLLGTLGEPAGWTLADGWSRLFNPSPSGYVYSIGMSADGSAIVGSSRFLWTAADGARFLTELDLAPPSATSITAISDDGSTIVGY